MMTLTFSGVTGNRPLFRTVFTTKVFAFEARSWPAVTLDCEQEQTLGKSEAKGEPMPYYPDTNKSHFLCSQKYSCEYCYWDCNAAQYYSRIHIKSTAIVDYKAAAVTLGVSLLVSSFLEWVLQYPTQQPLLTSASRFFLH